MAFSREIYAVAIEKLNSERAAAIAEAKKRRESFIRKCPAYAELEAELSRTGKSLVRAIFGGEDDPKAKVDEIRRFNTEVQAEMTRMLTASGHPADYLEPRWNCRVCSDTGLAAGKICDCVKRAMKRIAYERLNEVTPLRLSTFDTFSLDHYPDNIDQARGLSPRRMMEITYKKCRDYARDFTLRSKSLLLQGGVGLGKTHLSLAIAGEVIDKGYDVVYGTAQEFFGKIEREKFSRAASEDDTLAVLNSVDLLILDDLGTEFTTPFTSSVLHEIVSTRLLYGRPTIISTNLNFDGLSSRYSERVISRIHGSYSRFQFVGKDVRIVLRTGRDKTMEN